MMNLRKIFSFKRFTKCHNSSRRGVLLKNCWKIILWKLKILSLWNELASWFITSLQEHSGVPFLFKVRIFGGWRKPICMRVSICSNTPARSRERCHLRFWRSHRLRECRGLLAKSELKPLRCREAEDCIYFFGTVHQWIKFVSTIAGVL